ncbi:MAG: ankyrin repeat domain-containing protein [Clostridia bacterium]|uniref:ankyrin repeat domain-containing protein n=1 Tax=Pumilibacter muris TaxID=2941510 RepID=UPI00203A7DCE|nr:ankyrin repeat domain-containing protein [Pumilibacter muris]MCI8596549.1 ankyrin repeat domain-containing protein [Clostridia bacterium]
MATKEQLLQKERAKTLGELFVAECRADEPNFDTLRTMCVNGADVCYRHATALHWAAKLNNFSLVSFLIDNGVLREPVSRSIIANMCNNKGFNEELEPRFFEVLDDVRRVSGSADIDIFVPYINSMAVLGRLDKLRALMKRYFLTEAEVARSVFIRIIFEVILHAHDEMLEFINKHVEWQNQTALDLAVSGGDWVVLEYLLKSGKVGATPSDNAVGQAVFTGSTEVLDILLHCGYSFNRNPQFLKKACRAAFNDGGRMLEYMLNHGYNALDRYDNRTLRENAMLDGNAAALAVLDAINA